MPRVTGPVVLVLFDGWGYRPEPFGNVVAEAETPNYDQLRDAYPHVTLAASGPAVGLSADTVGSAAAAFSTIAAGRPIEQPPLRLDRALDNGSFRTNAVLRDAAARVLETGGQLHLLGLVSDGQVVSAERHYFELLALLQEAGVPGARVRIHAILDGYDTPPRSGMNYLARFAAEMMRTGVGRVATLMGRTYGMSSTGGWEATERAYAALVHGVGRLVPSAIQAIQAGYSRGEDDATLSPSVVLGSDGLPLGPLRDGDVVICFNHREVGIERLLMALMAEDFPRFIRDPRPRPHCVTLTQYSYAEELGCEVAFPAPATPPSLGARVTGAGRRMGLVIESFVEGHVRRLAAGADWERVSTRVVDSPPPEDIIARPERLTRELTDAAVSLLAGGECDLVVVDYVSADLAGHFGQEEVARRAVEALDAALPPLVRTARRAKATVLLTAGYGNVEELELSHLARPNPAHTTNPVPLLLINDRFKGQQVAGAGSGSLADLAPTVLGLLGLPIPGEMTGRDLVAALAPPGAAGAAAGEAAGGPLEISPAEAIHMVLLTGHQARSYYLAAANRSADPDSVLLYGHLAREEEGRLRGLEWRYELLEGAAPPAEAGPPAGLSLPEPALTPLQVIERAVDEELATWQLLAEMAVRNVDPQGRAVLEQLASEELELMARLERLSESEAIRVLASFTAPRGEVP